MNYVPMTCPFCKEDDFDSIGLKLHLQAGWCSEYNAIERPRSMAVPKSSEVRDSEELDDGA